MTPPEPRAITLTITLPVATHEAMAKWAADVGIPVAELVARLATRYVRSPAATHDAVDDRIGATLLQRAVPEADLPDGVQRLADALRSEPGDNEA
jgi:hypothetical protein